MKVVPVWLGRSLVQVLIPDRISVPVGLRLSIDTTTISLSWIKVPCSDLRDLHRQSSASSPKIRGGRRGLAS